MRGKGLTDRDIQLSQSARCPSVYGKMAKVEDVGLNVVINQRRGTTATSLAAAYCLSQWRAAARERRYSSPRSLGKELVYSDQDEACGGTKRLSGKKGNASIVPEWRSTSPLGKHFPPWLIAYSESCNCRSGMSKLQRLESSHRQTLQVRIGFPSDLLPT